MEFGNYSVKDDKKTLNPRQIEYGSAEPIKELIGRSAGLAMMPFGGIGQLAVDPTPSEANVFVRKLSPNWKDAVKKYGTKKLPWGEEVVEIPTGKMKYNTSGLVRNEEQFMTELSALSDNELRQLVGNNKDGENIFDYIKHLKGEEQARKHARNLLADSNPTIKMSDIVSPEKHPEFYWDNPAKKDFKVQLQNLGRISGEVDFKTPDTVGINSTIAKNLQGEERDAFIRQMIDHESTHAVDIYDSAKILGVEPTDRNIQSMLVSNKFDTIDGNKKANMMMRENPITNMLLTYKSSPQEWIARQAQFRTYLPEDMLDSIPLSYGNTGESLPFGKIIKSKITKQPFDINDAVEINKVGIYPRPTRFENKGEWLSDFISQGKYKQAGDIIKKHADDFNRYTYKGLGLI